MTIHSSDELVWKNNKLYYQNNKFMEVVEYSIEGYPDGTYWRIKFPKGSLSNEYYNLSTAKDNAKRQALLILNEDLDRQEML